MTRFCLAAVLVLAACGERATGPKITLRYHPPAGAVYRYTLEQHNAMAMQGGPLAGMGKQELVMRIHFTQAVKGPVPGGVEVQVTFDSTQMEAPGVPPEMMARELARLRGLRSTVLFDERGQVVRTDFVPAPGVPPEMTAQMAAGVKTMSFAFPLEPVGQGDSWTVATELPMGQLPGASASRSGTARTTLTVKEIRIAGSDTTVVLDVKTTFPNDPIQLDVGGQRATLRLSGTMLGGQEYSLTRGTVVAGTLKGTMKMNITGGSVGRQGMDMTSDAETTLRLSP